MRKNIIVGLVIGFVLGFFTAGLFGFDISDVLIKSGSHEELGAINSKELFRKAYDLDDHIYEIISGDELYEMIDNNETFIVYIGRHTCPYCQKIVPALMAAAENNDIDILYHIDITDQRNQRFAIEQGIDAVPLVIFFKDGEPVNGIPGFVDQETIDEIIKEIY